MKILAIIGSPRKGNTYRIVQKFSEYLQESDEIEFHYLFLRDVNLKQCIGCFQCIQKGHDCCPLQDDKEMILHKILDSDGVILATPAYNFNVSTLMKNFIDRFAHLGHQPKFFDQHIMIIATTAGTGSKEVITYLTKHVAKLWGFRTAESIGLLTPPYEKSDKLIEKDDRILRNKAKVFLRRMKLQDWSPKFYHIEQFCSLRAIFSLEKMKNSFPADYDLYSSLWGNRFYFDRPVNSFLYGIACVQAQFLKALIKTTFEKDS